MKKIVSVLLLAVTLLGVVSLTACGTKTVKLEQYVAFKAEGLDGFGTVTAEFNEKAFIRDNPNMKLTKQGKQNEMLREMLDTCSVAELFCEMCVSCDLSASRDLSNGETVTLTWDLERSLMKYFDCKVDASSVTYTVHGLQEVPEFDPFSGISVSFTGVAPAFGYQIVRSADTPAEDGYSFEAALESGADGSTLVLTAKTYGDAEDYVRSYGKKMSVTEKRFPVPQELSRARYVSAETDIPADTLRQLHTMSDAWFRANETANWVAPESCVGFTYAGSLIYTAKNGLIEGEHSADELLSCVCLVYQVDVEEGTGRFSYYYYTCADNLIADANGAVRTPDAFYETSHAENFFDSKPEFEQNGLYYLGCRTKDEMRAYLNGEFNWMSLTADTLG